MPRDPAALSAIINKLTDTRCLFLPDSAESWEDLIKRVSTAGVVAEVDAETFDYFLDVLPPKWMGHGCYCFAEGAEALRYFYKSSGRFFCRQMTWDETAAFCAAAGIPKPD